MENGIEDGTLKPTEMTSLCGKIEGDVVGAEAATVQRQALPEGSMGGKYQIYPKQCNVKCDVVNLIN